MNQGNLGLYKFQRPDPTAAKYRPSILVSNGKVKRTFVISRETMASVDALSANLEAPQSHLVEFCLRTVIGMLERGEMDIPTTVAVRRVEMPPIMADQATAGAD